VDHELYGRRCGNVPSAWAITVLRMALQHLSWKHSAGHGCTGPEAVEVMEKTRFASLTSRHRPGRARVGGRTPFEGDVVLFRGVRRGGSMGVGGTWSRNDTGHLAQHLHNVEDGCTVAGWSNSEAVSEDRRGGGSPLTRAPAMCQSF
jgi:hypothetical protein